MNIQIQSIRFKADKDLLELIETKLQKAFGKYSFITNCKVYLKLTYTEDKKNKIVEIYLHANNGELFAHDNEHTFEFALTSTIDKIKRQLKKYKEKTYSSKP